MKKQLDIVALIYKTPRGKDSMPGLPQAVCILQPISQF